MAHKTTIASIALPHIRSGDGFDAVVKKLAAFFVRAVESPHSFEELRSKKIYSRTLKPLVRHLVSDVHHEATVSALLALKWHFSQLEDDDDRGINHTRGLACELVAWRFVTHLTEREAIEHLCYELPPSPAKAEQAKSSLHVADEESAQVTERSPLLDGAEELEVEEAAAADRSTLDMGETLFATTFAGLSALEIAAVADAKKFLSQKVMQRTIDGIWRGDIIFWDSLNTRSTKRAQVYSRAKSDPYCRLKVPLYLKIFEVAFFAAFLAFYYVVLVEKNDEVTAPEVMLYIWLAAFAYNELVEFLDAGTVFYATDFWALWDVAIIATGVAFFITRMVGLAKSDLRTMDTAYDILAVEALFLVPRLFSLISLHPYFGILLPAMKEMTKEFLKFICFVAILYIGFDTCFTFLARGSYSLAKMNWILVKVFFGSGYLGFDIAEEISPILGPPLMFIFVCMTNILLITSLISLMSNSLTKIMDHSREEYLYVYSVFVLEAATSNRLTYFLPPLNLLALLIRPLRLLIPADRLRSLRIALLRATHWPFVALILAYEHLRLHVDSRRDGRSLSAALQGPQSSSRLARSFSARHMQTPPRAARSAMIPLVEEARADEDVIAKPPGAAFETVESNVAVSHLTEIKAQLEQISALLEKVKTQARASDER